MCVYKKQTFEIHDLFLMCCSGPIPSSTGLTFHPIPLHEKLRTAVEEGNIFGIE